jgi:hypothetical protein
LFATHGINVNESHLAAVQQVCPLSIKLVSYISVVSSRLILLYSKLGSNSNKDQKTIIKNFSQHSKKEIELKREEVVYLGVEYGRYKGEITPPLRR